MKYIDMQKNTEEVVVNGKSLIHRFLDHKGKLLRKYINMKPQRTTVSKA